MKFDQVYYTSSTTGTRGGAGFQINAHSGTLDPDIQREVEAYSLYTPPTNCPRTPETPQEFAQFPISYKYRMFGGRRPGFCRSIYLGKDYNSVRYGNFFTHIILGQGQANENMLQDPAVLQKLEIWAAKASTTTDISPIELDPGLFSKAVSYERLFASNPHFKDLIAFCLAGLKDKKTTIIVDTPAATAKWISAVLSILPRNIRSQISFSTYEYNPQNLDYNLCGTTLDSGFDFSEASFKFNFYILDFSSDRFSPALEYRSFVDIIGNLGASGDHAKIANLLEFMYSITHDPGLEQLDSLAKLWLLLEDNTQTSSLLRAIQLIQEIKLSPSDDISKRLLNWLKTAPELTNNDIKLVCNFCMNDIMKKETDPQKKLIWIYTILLVLVRHYPIADLEDMIKLSSLLQSQGGLIALASYDELVKEIKAQFSKSGIDHFYLMKLCQDLHLTDHPVLSSFLKAAFKQLIFNYSGSAERYNAIAASLTDRIPYAEAVFIEQLSLEPMPVQLNPLLLKLIGDPGTKKSLTALLNDCNKKDTLDSLELLELLSRSNWEEAAKHWWMVNRLNPAKLSLHGRFWTLANDLHPRWAPIDFLSKDPYLIKYSSFMRTFWIGISSYNPLQQYDKKISDLLAGLDKWFKQPESAQYLNAESRNIAAFVANFLSVFMSTDSSPITVVKTMIKTIPTDFPNYGPSLGTQLIMKLNTPTRKSSDWESLLSAINTSVPKALNLLLETEASSLKDFPPSFWIGLANLALRYGTNLPEELKRLIKKSVNSLPEAKQQDILAKVKDNPALEQFFGTATKPSLLKRIIQAVFGKR